MQVKWTGAGLSDLARLHDFLAAVNMPAAARVVQSLTAAASNLPDNPRIGRKLAQFEPREVRRIFIGAYEMRYEIAGAAIYVLRIWHTKEYR
jgi:plasmid stabilization system protein ParE